MPRQADQPYKLGMPAYIQIPTPDRDRSLDFYRRAQFTAEGDWLTDGMVTLRINTEPTARQALVLTPPDPEVL